MLVFFALLPAAGVKAESKLKREADDSVRLVTAEEASRLKVSEGKKETEAEVLLRSCSGTGRAVWLDTEGEAVEIPSGEKKQGLSSLSLEESGSALPFSFDLREEEGRLSQGKDQGAYGTCWAMAGLSAVESNVLSQKLFFRESWLTDGSLAFSASGPGWYLFENPPEGDGRHGDYIERNYKGAEGGDYTGVIAALAASGVQLEKNAPYTNWNYGQSMGRDVSYYQLKNADYLPYASTKEAQETVKQWIVSSGAVECGMYFTQMKHEDCYYQTGYGAAYGNHEVVLIGWDDHYRKENFKENGETPKYDGAWIARNSYGESWGEDGCFYISYEEPSLYGFIRYEMEEKTDGELCRQYDGAGGLLGVSSSFLGAAANVFTAPEKEELTEIGITLSELNASGADYTVDIYQWKEKQPELTASGMVNTGDIIKEESPKDYFTEKYRVTEARTQGTFDYSGYHKIPLSSSVALEEGESCAVVLTLSPKDRHSVVYYSFEGSIDGYDTEEFHYGVEECQSFYLDGFGKQAEWKDVTTLQKERDGFELGNLNLKAFTYSADRAGRESTEWKEQKAQLKETVTKAEGFLASAAAIEKKQKLSEEQKKIFAFTKGNTSYNEELLEFLEEECRFAEETLLEEDGKLYEISNACTSLENALAYFAYPAEIVVKKPEELYELSKQTSSLTVNALSLVSIEKDLIMNPASAFTFGRFDTEQPKKEKGVITRVDSEKARNFAPIGGRGGVEFTIDGNGHSISYLVSSASSRSEYGYSGAYGGLVGQMVSGTVKNLTIKDSYIEGNMYVGAFAGMLSYGGTIEGCRLENTQIRGYETIDESTYMTIASQYLGGFAGIASASGGDRKSGVYRSKMKESFVYGEFVTGGILGAVSADASAGEENTIAGSSVVGVASYSSYRSGVGLYLGGDYGSGDEKHYIFRNPSGKVKDLLLVDLYKPGKAGNDAFLLFLEPFQREEYVLKKVSLNGNARKIKRGKDSMKDGYRIKSMSGDIALVSVTKRQYTVDFYLPLTGKLKASQKVLHGKLAEKEKAPKIKGYRFLGWYDENGEKFRFRKKVKKDYELYARYQKRKQASKRKA